MLGRLPPELVDRILELTHGPAPFPDPDDVDQERRCTLYRCCLVCRDLRQRAQPLLQRQVTLRTTAAESDFVRLLGSTQAGELRPRVRVLRAGSAVGKDVLRATIGALPGLEEIHVMQTRMLSSDLADLAAPIVLLSDVSLARYGPTRPTMIVSISIHFHECYVYLDSFFTAELFPSLRALALGGLCGDDDVVRPFQIARPFRPPPAAFCNQLEVCQIWTGGLPVRARFETDNSRTPVLDYRLVGLAGVYPPFPAATSPHLRILFSPAFTASTSASYESLSRLLLDLVKLGQRAAPLKALHLPRVLLTLLSSAPEVLQNVHKIFVGLVQKKGADLVYHDEDEDDMWVVSQHFWRYAKELKAREVEEQ
ncbi:hypothetical protein JCM8097_006643 [Rhodosporidiobolus ruineniae]